MQEGILTRTYGGFYFVLAEGREYRCRLRGRHRLDREKQFLAGDRVLVRLQENGEGVVEELLPRRNSLIRPLVANVDMVLVVQALATPPPDRNLLDRMLVCVEAAGIPALLCLNKADLAPPAGVDELAAVYQAAGYPVLVASARTGQAVTELRQALRGRTTVLAGSSGVGKSSLLNAVQPGLALRTGAVSDRSERGRHTTRHVILLPLAGGGLVADTPGFSRLDLPDLGGLELDNLFPELDARQAECRFQDCMHRAEPDCAVRQAVEGGAVDPVRYQHYLDLLAESAQRERSY